MPRLKCFKWDSWAAWTLSQIMRDAPDIIAIDTETMGVGFYDDVFAAQLTWRSPEGELRSGYINLDTDEVPLYVFPGEVRPTDRQPRIEGLSAALAVVPRWVLHNAKFDLQKLMLIGAITPESLEQHEIHDTQTLFVLLDENSRKALKVLAVNVLGVDDTVCVEVKSGKNKGTWKRVPKEAHELNAVRRKLKLKKEDGFHLLPRDVLIPYALKDTEFTLLLWETLRPQLEAVGDPRLLELYDEFMELKLVLFDMEADGFCLDVPYLDETTSDYGVKVLEGWEQIVKLTGDPDFNPGSWQQVQAAFEKRGIFLDSTAVSELGQLDDELATELLQYRSDKKIHGTYLTTMQSEHRDGRIHPNFNDDAARTGRMSSSAASNN